MAVVAVKVVVVEDDPVAADAHREYVERIAGFTVAGVVHSGGAAVRFCERHQVDLVMLDFYLPDTHGLAVCRALRATGAGSLAGCGSLPPGKSPSPEYRDAPSDARLPLGGRPGRSFCLM